MTKDEALKMAIEALDEYPVSTGKLRVALEACKKALEQPDRPTNAVLVPADKLKDMQRRLKALEQPAQEPYKCHWVEKGKGHCERNNRMGLPDVYTHPHQWQGLTDDEINEIHHKWIMNSGIKDTQYDFARAIEQALKEKNT